MGPRTWVRRTWVRRTWVRRTWVWSGFRMARVRMAGGPVRPMSPLENPCRCEEIRADPGRDGIQHRRL